MEDLVSKIASRHEVHRKNSESQRIAASRNRRYTLYYSLARNKPINHREIIPKF